jgi:hypothetical protein
LFVERFTDSDAGAYGSSILTGRKRTAEKGRMIRRVSNGDQVSRVAAVAMKCGKSVDFTGYWQRHGAE